MGFRIFMMVIERRALSFVQLSTNKLIYQGLQKDPREQKNGSTFFDPIVLLLADKRSKVKVLGFEKKGDKIKHEKLPSTQPY
jgi:hypothetical protein